MVSFAIVRLVARIDEVTVRVGIFVKGRIQKGNYFPWMQTLTFRRVLALLPNRMLNSLVKFGNVSSDRCPTCQLCQHAVGI